jgi:hypothetical protein
MEWCKESAPTLNESSAIALHVAICNKTHSLETSHSNLIH